MIIRCHFRCSTSLLFVGSLSPSSSPHANAKTPSATVRTCVLNRSVIQLRSSMICAFVGTRSPLYSLRNLAPPQSVPPAGGFTGSFSVSTSRTRGPALSVSVVRLAVFNDSSSLCPAELLFLAGPRLAALGPRFLLFGTDFLAFFFLAILPPIRWARRWQCRQPAVPDKICCRVAKVYYQFPRESIPSLTPFPALRSAARPRPCWHRRSADLPCACLAGYPILVG